MRGCFSWTKKRDTWFAYGQKIKTMKKETRTRYACLGCSKHIAGQKKKIQEAFC